MVVTINAFGRMTTTDSARRNRSSVSMQSAADAADYGWKAAHNILQRQVGRRLLSQS